MNYAERIERAYREALELLATGRALTVGQLVELTDQSEGTMRAGLAGLYDAGYADLAGNGRWQATYLGTLAARRRLMAAWVEDEPGLVNGARWDGASWTAIARAAGMSRQAAHKRWAAACDAGTELEVTP